MRDLIAETALRIYQKLKGTDDMMAMLYASKIVMGSINRKTGEEWTFSDVPEKLKAQVAEILINECGLPELVPMEYGGTAE